MDKEQVTQAVKQFSALGGKPFRSENPHRLMLKFIAYRFFPANWHQVLGQAFADDKRIGKQIEALSAVPRDRMPRLSDEQWFHVLNSLEYQHSVDADNTLTVHQRARPYKMPHYARFAEQVKGLASGLSAQRNTLFLLQLADPDHARNILYDTPVMARIGLGYEDTQRRLMPLLAGGREEARAEKLTELAAILQFARFDLKRLNMPLLERANCVQSSLPVEPVALQRKHVLAAQFEQLSAQRDELLETVDEEKLAANFHDGIRERIAWRPPIGAKLSKAELADACSTMQHAVNILGEVQMDYIDKHRRTLQKIDELRQERSKLLRTARQQALYSDGKSEVIEWQVPSTRNMHPTEANSVVGKLEQHIGQLKNYQIEAV